MKIQPIVPAALCVLAGALLVEETVREWLSAEKFDTFFFCVGLYFIGKGLFIHSLLGLVSEKKSL